MEDISFPSPAQTVDKNDVSIMFGLVTLWCKDCDTNSCKPHSYYGVKGEVTHEYVVVLSEKKYNAHIMIRVMGPPGITQFSTQSWLDDYPAWIIPE